jgi:hypothetical protein
MESPASMLVPLLFVSIGLVVAGLYTGSIVNHLIAHFDATRFLWNYWTD